MPAQEHPHACSQRGHLGQGEVDEDDAAPDNVVAQVGVDAGEHQTQHQRRLQERDGEDLHHLPPVKAATRASKWAK